MEEILEIWTSDGKPSGKTLPKDLIHREGHYHATVHLWCYTDFGRLLFQQRSTNKKNFPGLWDVSVAGHVEAGEALKLAALREAREELGLSIPEQELEYLDVYKEEHRHGPEYLDREFHHTYLYRLPYPLPDMQLQKEEVADIALVPLTQCAEEILGLANPGKYVPHQLSYYKAVFQAIKNRL